jgi:hypothetical protein
MNINEHLGYERPQFLQRMELRRSARGHVLDAALEWTRPRVRIGRELQDERARVRPAESHGGIVKSAVAEVIRKL